MDRMPCLGAYALSVIRSRDPQIKRRGSQPIHSKILREFLLRFYIHFMMRKCNVNYEEMNMQILANSVLMLHVKFVDVGGGSVM